MNRGGMTMNLTVLYEKIASLPPSLLPKVECFVDSLSTMGDGADNVSNDSDDHDGEKPFYYANGQKTYISDPDHNWSVALYDENGKKVHPQPGCMKGTFVMHDNFFEPDDDWEEYM